MCYIRYRICNAQIKARVKYKVFEFDILKNTENDKKHTTKVFKKVFVCCSKIHILIPLNHSMLGK